MNDSAENLAEHFNRVCDCQLLDKPALQGELDAVTGLAVSPQMFSSLAVFLDPRQADAMRELVSAISTVVETPGYRHEVLGQAPDIVRHDPHTAGVFLGFDFHQSADGPQLIEINTNAGGAFLNLAALDHQRACCPGPRSSPAANSTAALEGHVHAMFLEEWRRARSDRPLRSIAIVDEQPRQQFLYPEFLLAREFFRARGIRVTICDPSELAIVGDELRAAGEGVDLVYNRLTDFYFEDLRNQAWDPLESTCRHASLSIL